MMEMAVITLFANFNLIFMKTNKLMVNLITCIFFFGLCYAYYSSPWFISNTDKAADLLLRIKCPTPIISTVFSIGELLAVGVYKTIEHLVNYYLTK